MFLQRVTLFLNLVFVVTYSNTAIAGLGEHTVGLDVGYLQADGDLLTYGLDYGYGVNDFLNIVIEIDHATPVMACSNCSNWLQGRAGVRYHIDALRWIPYVKYTNGVYGILADSTWEAAYGMHFGAGLDYRRSRAFAVGIWSGYDWIVTGNYPNYFAAGLSLSLYTR